MPEPTPDPATVAVLYHVDLESVIDHLRSRGATTARRRDGTALTEREVDLVAAATAADVRAVLELHRFERDRATERCEVGHRLHELLTRYVTPEAETIGPARLLMPPAVRASSTDSPKWWHRTAGST